MFITGAWIREHMACFEQRDLFEAEWPDGTEITAASLSRAIELALDINWLATMALPTPALKVYKEARAPARKVYEEAKATALLAAIESMDRPDGQDKKGASKWNS